MSKNKIAMLLGFVCIVLVIAICVQIKTISFVNNSVSSTYAEDQLRDEVLKWKENLRAGLSGPPADTIQGISLRIHPIQQGLEISCLFPCCYVYFL